MKNILFTFCLLLVASMGFSQVKVVSDGDVLIGPEPSGTPGQANLKSYGASQLEFAIDAAAGNPDFTMQVAGASKAQFRYNPTKQGLEIKVDDSNTGDFGVSPLAIFVDGSNQRVGIGNDAPASRLHVSGTITHGGLSGPSDIRLKTDVREYGAGLEEVLKIQPKYFKYNGKANLPTDRQQVGVIAQEFQKIAPELVTTFQYRESVDSENGEKTEITSVEEYLTVNTDAIRFMLVNAIQEQQEMISTLQSQVAELTEIVEKGGIANQSVTLQGGGQSFLGQNIPNPTDGFTTINYEMTETATSGTIQFIDMTGKLLKEISLEGKTGTVNVNASDIPTGTYSYSLVVDGQLVGTKKMVVTK